MFAPRTLTSHQVKIIVFRSSSMSDPYLFPNSASFVSCQPFGIRFPLWGTTRTYRVSNTVGDENSWTRIAYIWE